MPNDSIRYSKQISDQGRERSVEVRRERAALKERLKAGEIAPVDVLNDESRVAAKIRMFAFLKNCPGVGAVGARTLLRALGLSETKRLKAEGFDYAGVSTEHHAEELSEEERSLLRPKLTVINLILIVAVWFVLNSLIQSGVITNYWSGILITVGINIILATSLNVATGYLGQLPLGHAGFMAVGAYAGGIFMKAMPVQELLKSGNTGAAIPYILLALLISAIVAGTFGIIIGIPALRLRGDYLAIITLGFGEIIRVILTNIDSVIGTDFTYGAAGLKRIPKYSSFTLVFICVVVCCYIIHTVMKSRHGRAILSIREDEIASESVGVQTTYYKTFAFVLSAMMAGIAGCLYAGYLGSLYPSTFKFMKSIEILVMVVLGGMGSMLGSVISASVLTILPELLRSFSDYRMVVYSLALVIMMIFRPKGLLGSYDFSLSRTLEAVLNRIFRPNLVKKSKKEAAEHE